MLEAKFEASACTYEFHEQDLLQEKSAQTNIGDVGGEI